MESKQHYDLLKMKKKNKQDKNKRSKNNPILVYNFVASVQRNVRLDRHSYGTYNRYTIMRLAVQYNTQKQ